MMRPLAVLTLLLAVAVRWSGRYVDHPPLAHTGGFGEPTCRRCHFEYPLNEPGGRLAIRGLPDTCRSDTSYTLQLTLQHAEMLRAGFELAVRYADSGRQAGRLHPRDDRVRRDTLQGVWYAFHSPAGTELTAPGKAVWRLRWVPPDTTARVVLHAVANAANDDASEFGDRIYQITASCLLNPR
ncbi:choice-of-anchor V domain-containing protein [Rhodothermus marinus]|uniref:Reelin domain-containing protein n=1 Tax=Rhodothermus marinus (strain ATCC 43812 / DSM 4252 / R-10) TaxID=518766 RepID=D0MKG1_RHOM4|nr:choice-of-anchor V domain-containing protein [Rhodothermus marinus]ACY48873.1 hypothetical protein Rmar_1991 [Rhodothermus marinus DSM 4252]